MAYNTFTFGQANRQESAVNVLKKTIFIFVFKKRLTTPGLYATNPFSFFKNT